MTTIVVPKAIAQILTCGQSYKQFTLVNYDARVGLTRNCLHYDSRVVIYECILLYKIGH